MKKILLIVLSLMIGADIFAQDPQFSQYYQAPLYMNPGFTGITPQQRVAINHRIQWPNLAAGILNLLGQLRYFCG
jgi:hypothetical protein